MTCTAKRKGYKVSEILKKVKDRKALSQYDPKYIEELKALLSDIGIVENSA